MRKSLIDKTKAHFLKKFKNGNCVYPFLARHVAEAEKWAKKILKNHLDADEEIVLISVWLHDIGHIDNGINRTDHAVISEEEAKIFLKNIKMPDEKIAQVAHSVRSHRCKDVIPKTLEAKILAAADSASHFTDINYIEHMSSGHRDYAFSKIERDYRDISLFPELKKELTPLYKAWKKLLKAYPEI